MRVAGVNSDCKTFLKRVLLVYIVLRHSTKFGSSAETS